MVNTDLAQGIGSYSAEYRAMRFQVFMGQVPYQIISFC